MAKILATYISFNLNHCCSTVTRSVSFSTFRRTTQMGYILLLSLRKKIQVWSCHEEHFVVWCWSLGGAHGAAIRNPSFVVLRWLRVPRDPERCGQRQHQQPRAQHRLDRSRRLPPGSSTLIDISATKICLKKTIRSILHASTSLTKWTWFVVPPTADHLLGENLQTGPVQATDRCGQRHRRKYDFQTHWLRKYPFPSFCGALRSRPIASGWTCRTTRTCPRQRSWKTGSRTSCQGG